MLLFNENRCVDIFCENTNPYVHLALEDMLSDFMRISESCVCPRFVDSKTEHCIVIEKNTVNDCNALEDESFCVKIEKNMVIISAKSYLGTMWGIYTFCEKCLGVEPCYLFDDFETEKHKSMEIADITISKTLRGFRFRGFFINDEDLLTSWTVGGGMRKIDYPWYGTTLPEKVMNMIAETALRLKMNLIIPASFIDICNPPEKLLVDCVARRGIYISQHHIEPVGVSSFTFKNYCKNHNKNAVFSYAQDPDTMEEAWNLYAEKWAEYDNVVWQIGLRGEADRPIWQEQNPTDDELKAYGKFINKAYEKQKEIITKATNGKAKYFTSTLWMEGSALIQKGYLKIPEDTITVFADTGLNQMYGNEYYSIKRDKNSLYGIYYHLQYFGSGPHLAPQTGLNKLYYNTELAYKNGDNSYYIMNVSNIREFVFEIKAFSQMAWNTNKFSADEYLNEYCKKFGVFANDMEYLIKKYYNCLPDMDGGYLLKHPYSKYFNFLTDSTVSGIKNYILKDGDIILDYGGFLVRNFYVNIEYDMYENAYRSIKNAIPEYKRICAQFENIASNLPHALQKHIEVKWLLYSKTLLCIYEWYFSLWEAKTHYDSNDCEKMKIMLNRACKSLDDYLTYRKCAEYGIFKNWYRGESKLNIRQTLLNTQKLLAQAD